MSDTPQHDARSLKERQRYLIGNVEPASLLALAKIFKEDPQIDLLDVKGPAERPSLLVAEMAADRVEQLKQQFHGLIVEPDAPLMG